MRGAPTSTILTGFHIKHISPVRNYILKSLFQFPFAVSGLSVLKPLRIRKFYGYFRSEPHLYNECQSFPEFSCNDTGFYNPPPQRVVQCARLRNFPLPQINSEPRRARMCHLRGQKDNTTEWKRDPQRIMVRNGIG